MSKPLQPPQQIVDSLLSLKEELESRTYDASLRECLFKINSCLYSHYPITQPPYLTKEVTTVVRKFNPAYDQDASCVCGHPYSRHFDWSNDDDPCGCKYCGCDTFETPDEAVD